MYIEGQIPNQQKDEKLILFLRRHWSVFVGKWLIYIFLSGLPIGLYYSLVNLQPQILNDKISYPFLLLLASLYYLFMVLFFFNAFIDYYLDVWIVTSQRIINIEQRGLFNREIAEHTLDKIQDVSGIQKGFTQTLFGYGNVHVQTAGEIQRFVFQQVKSPFDVVRVINGLIEKKEEKLEHEIADKLNPLE